MPDPAVEIFTKAVGDAIEGVFRQTFPELLDERPYGFAIILGQVGNYVGYAFATERRLTELARHYYELGYRRDVSWLAPEAIEISELGKWLRWANPDDGWVYGDFDDRFRVDEIRQDAVASNKFGEESCDLEKILVESLSKRLSSANWRRLPGGLKPVIGLTYGDDPQDFMRTATLLNEYDAVLRLWREYSHGNVLGERIKRMGTKP